MDADCRMERHERERRRDAFLACADDYQSVRPEYPSMLLEEAVTLAHLQAGSELLEVGCGTGQVTEWLAARGFSVLALDRSPDMAELAAGRLRDFENVEVRSQDFEAGVPDSRYAALVAATSYHWLDPATRAERCARALRPRGALIALWHTHPTPYTGFFARSQPTYRAFVPDWTPPPSPGMTEERLRVIVSELRSAGAFDSVERRSHDWSRTYPRDAYLRLLNTYSDHRLLPHDLRAKLFGELGTMIDEEFAGRVERPYRTELVVARRAD